MSIPSSPPPYRKPGFVLEHTGREPGASYVITGPASPADAPGRLADDLASRPVRLAAPAAAGAGWALSRTTELRRLPVNLIGISGQNWYRNRATMALRSSDPAADGPLYYTGTTDPVVEIGAPGGTHWLPRVVDASHNFGSLQKLISAQVRGSSGGTEPLAAGEFYAGPVIEPADGVDSTWVFDEEANLRTSTTLSGITKIVRQGVPRRLYTLEIQRVPAPALPFWKQVVGAASDGRTFVYLPPEQARWKSPRIITDNVNEFAGAPGDTSLVSPGFDGSAQAFRLTSNATPTGIQRAASILAATFPNGGEDWRGKWLAFDARLSNPSNNPTNALSVRLFSRQGSGGTAGATTFDLSDWLVPSNIAADEWFRCYIDLESHDSGIAAASYPVDLGFVDRVEMRFTAGAAGDSLDFCNIDLIEPKWSPAFVNLDSHSIEQDSNSPLQDPTYRVRLGMIEAIG